MKKRILICLVVLLTAQIGNTQISSLKWAKQHGGSTTDQVKSVATDLSGNVITGGVFSGTANFDVSGTDLEFTSLGFYDGFVSKLDVNGNFLWAIQIGNSNDNYVTSVATDNNENVYVSGAFQGVVDFDPSANTMNLTSAGSTDGFIAKYNPTGSLIWAKQISGTSQIDVFSLKVDNTGNVYSVGTFYQTADFDPGLGIVDLTSQGEFDGFVLKLDNNGDFLWVNQVKGNQEITVSDIEIDSNDDIVAIGSFSEVVDFHSTAVGASLTSSVGFISAFFLKLDNAGDFVWVKQIGGTGNVFNNSIISDASNDLYVTGEFTSNISFNPNGATNNLSSLGDKDGFLLKLTSIGDYSWVKQMGGTQSVRARGVGIGSNNQVYVTGSYRGSVNFNLPQTPARSITSNGGSDIFVTQYKMSDGAVVDLNGFGSVPDDIGLALAVSNSGLVHVGGDFRMTVDFNPLATPTELTSLGITDGFVIQLGDCNTTGTDVQVACGSFVWNGTTYNASNNTATKTIPNAEGCDSIITLNLTINQSVHHAENVTACESAIINGNNYTASQNVIDTYTGAAANGCDSIVTTNLTILFPVTRTESISACDTAVVNGTAYTSSQSVVNTYPAANTCDSIVTTNITIKHSVFKTETVTACGSVVINGNTYTTSQTVVDTYTAQAYNFCDSIVTRTITINDYPDATTTLSGNTITANLTGASYQWIDCDNANSPISGATDISFTPTNTGNYAVIVDNGDCVETSACVEVVTVGLNDEVNPEFGAKIYPNPTSNLLNITLADASIKEFKIELLDALGKVIQTQTVKSNTTSLNMSNYQRGVYFVRVRNDAEQMTYRVIKQ